MQNKVTLLIDGKRHEGWKAVKVSASIEQIARAFAVSITSNLPDGERPQVVKAGDAVQLLIDDELVCTGWVTSTPIAYTGRSVTVNVQGKSKTVDLVDCCFPLGTLEAPKASTETDWGRAGLKNLNGEKVASVGNSGVASSWKAIPTAELISTLAGHYGVKVKTQIDLGVRQKRFSVTPGDTVFKAINSLLCKDNLVVTDNASGDLVVVKAGADGRATDALETGKNILEASAGFDGSRLFSDYVFLGQHAGTDEDHGEMAANDKGTAKCGCVKRKRLYVHKETGQTTKATCANRAKFESQYREANFWRVAYVVQGWKQSDGKLWKPNTLVRVDDKVLGVHRQMLIVSVEYTLDAGGMKTRLTVVPIEGYQRAGTKEAKATDKAGFDFSNLKKVS